MSEVDRNSAASFGPTFGRGQTIAVDQGLRAYLLHIYSYMALGLVITGFAAVGLYLLSVTGDLSNAVRVVRDGAEGYATLPNGEYLTPLGNFVFATPFKWVLFLAPLVLVFVLSFGIGRLRPQAAQVLFWLYAALIGLSLASIFLLFTQVSIARVFFITAASFGALSLWGYTTPRDLTPLSPFLMMGLFGVILAGFVNLFMPSSAVQFAASVAGVIVFAGLTAWDTQRLKNEYLYAAMDEQAAEQAAILGALSLYLNLINLFTLLLQLLGQRDE